MRSKSFLFLLIVLVLGVVSGIGYATLKPRLGLDIQGGVRFTYQMDLAKLKTAEQRAQISTMQTKLVSLMQKRAVGPLGVTEPTVTKKGTDQIVVELPGIKDIAEAEKTMGSSARVEFYSASNVVVQGVKDNRPFRLVDRGGDKTDPTVSFAEAFGKPDPIEYLTADGKVNPRYQEIIRQWGDPIIQGEEVERAEGQPGPSGKTVVGLSFSPTGSPKMADWSRRNPRENIAIVLDGRVLSMAPLVEGAILEGGAQITGEFEPGYVAKLTELINSGALPVDLKLLSSESVDATIGHTALDRMIVAGGIAFGIVSLFLIVYYGFPGVVAFLALCLYVLFTLTVMKLIGATFSLAGIAGFILSVGMAVDANILVFERFKEEMKSGKTLATSIELGFKRALTAIIDSNVCTILTSCVLMYYGTGPVKGFATTLIIGVLISLFTAVTVTRSLLMFFVGSGIADNPKLYAIDRDWFGKLMRGANDDKPLRIVETSKKWFAISIATMVVSIPFFFIGGFPGGFKPNVEFRGGYEANYAVTGDVSTATITERLEKAGFKGSNVKLGTSGAGRIAYVTVPPLDQFKGKADADNIATIATAAGLNAADAKGFTQIGPQVQAETTNNAIMGIVASSVLIVLYLAFRFGTGVGGFGVGLRFSVSAIVALLHDVLVVFGLAAIVGYFEGWEVSALFLTAMLTIIGFSTHDTIVVFDRIRENLIKSKGKEEIGHLIDKSITQSFARSINTSSTVIITLAILAFFGTTTPDLRFFVVAMLIGILSGTYSSIYNASPILYLVNKMAVKKRGEEAGLQYLAKTDAERARIMVTEAASAAVVGSDGRSYGQVRRRANSPTKGHEIDD